MRNFPSVALTRLAAVAAIAALVGATTGCGGSSRLPTVPVEGKVLYEGKPLAFGSVVFQPEVGPPARGIIQPDGTFKLTTYAETDGAVLGKHKVMITCFDSQKPGAPPPDPKVEPGVGQSLIPRKYASPSTSGLEREVKVQNDPIVFELTP